MKCPECDNKFDRWNLLAIHMIYNHNYDFDRAVEIIPKDVFDMKNFLLDLSAVNVSKFVDSDVDLLSKSERKSCKRFNFLSLFFDYDKSRKTPIRERTFNSKFWKYRKL